MGKNLGPLYHEDLPDIFAELDEFFGLDEPNCIELLEPLPTVHYASDISFPK
jgi:hypothetical protein